MSTKNVKENILRNRQSLLLLIYDLFVAIFVCFFMIEVYLHLLNMDFTGVESFISCVLFLIIVFTSRYVGKIYKQIWRYGGVQSYLRLIGFDYLALIVFCIIDRLLPIERVTLGNAISLFSINLILCLTMRIVYRYCYKYGNSSTKFGKVLFKALQIASLNNVKPVNYDNTKKIPVAILGAGENGTNLATELLSNSNSIFEPRIFIDSSRDKIGRKIFDMDIYGEDCELKIFEQNEIQEVIFAANLSFEKRNELYDKYSKMGLKVKTYGSPNFNNGEKKILREFDPEELLFRKQKVIIDKETEKYYKNKVILITGGGGSIGSQMARELAKMSPKQIVLLDIYENGAYDVKTELNIIYKKKLDVRVEICSITNKDALEKVFSEYKPNIVVMAAAHKHVPLMEKNVIEAIYNNVFGTLNTVELSEKYKVNRVIMVSTDKAVNPTNVMGATKRMCEMIVSTHSKSKSSTTFSMTRFGNVLGSAGSVIPLFKKQISMGGPITITDKRIIRYFMTIPEASQLVLKSGAMAKNGELFVLDMSDPVKILDLAESLIKLSGLVPYKDINIVEVGLRPGEKLFEELLIDTKKLQKTKDELIFIDSDVALSKKELNANLDLLRKAIEDKDDNKAKKALMKVVPTYKPSVKK